MYRNIVIGIAALFISSSLSAQVPSAAESELFKLENDWAAAWQKRDGAYLQKLFADEYLSTDAEGNTFTKAQDLANVKNAGTSLSSFALTDLKAHVYGDTAVVTGLNTIKGTFNGK